MESPMKKSQRFLIKKPAETLHFVECQVENVESIEMLQVSL